MNKEELFNTDFSNDAEVEEMLDGLISAVGAQAKYEDMETQMINPYRIQEILYTYKVLKYLTRGSKAKVTYELHKPYKSMGYVSVSDKNLSFKNMKWFLKAVELSSNFEVYPKTNGTIQMNFTFHGLTKIIK